MLESSAFSSEIRRNLMRCWTSSARPFVQLFSGQVFPLHEYGGDVAPLKALGLVETSGNEGRALCPFVVFEGLFFKCDPPDLRLRNRVFPLHDDESLLLARWAVARTDQCVLEIGTGAGVVALCLAARGADKVIATDINPRVREYFIFNAEVNGLAKKVEYVNSNVFAGLGNDRFDVIVSNPPFVPVPKEANYFLHSDGGPLGTAVLEDIAIGWKRHLRPDGQLYAMALSVGNSAGWRVSHIFPESALTPIYAEPSLALQKFLERFRTVSGFETWKSHLLEHTFDRIGFFGLAAGRHASANLSRLQRLAKESCTNEQLTQWTDCSWSMLARLRRYQVWPQDR